MFFGRAELAEEAGRRISDPTGTYVITLCGASGSGKSSLLRSGLLPNLEPHRHPVLFTPGPHPLSELATAVTRLTGGDAEALCRDLALDPASLGAALTTWPAGRPSGTHVLLVVDQLEETFTRCADADERDAFLAALAEVTAGARHWLRIILAVRSDAVDRCLDHPDLAAALRDGARIPVGPPSRHELREMVVQPAARAGVTVEPDLVACVLTEAAQQPGALPWAAHVLRETWQARRGASLRLADYEAVGGLRRAVATTAEQVFTALPPARQDILRTLVLRLTAPGDGPVGARRCASRDELTGLAEQAELSAVLELLAAHRLIVLDGDGIHLAHDALLTAWPRLRRWLTEGREELRIHRQLTEAASAWQALGRDPGALYPGAKLALARRCAEHTGGANAQERDFLHASAAAHDASAAVQTPPTPTVSGRRHRKGRVRLPAGRAGRLTLWGGLLTAGAAAAMLVHYVWLPPGNVAARMPFDVPTTFDGDAVRWIEDADTLRVCDQTPDGVGIRAYVFTPAGTDIWADGGDALIKGSDTSDDGVCKESSRDIHEAAHLSLRVCKSGKSGKTGEPPGKCWRVRLW